MASVLDQAAIAVAVPMLIHSGERVGSESVFSKGRATLGQGGVLVGGNVLCKLWLTKIRSSCKTLGMETSIESFSVLA